MQERSDHQEIPQQGQEVDTHARVVSSNGIDPFLCTNSDFRDDAEWVLGVPPIQHIISYKCFISARV